MTAAGVPGEELLDSTEPERSSRSWPWVVPAVAALVAVAALFGFQALQPDPADIAQPTRTTTETVVAEPSLVDASARRLYGEVPPTGAQGFSSALRAATSVVGTLCRPDVPAWAASLISSDYGYDQAVFLMSPANRTFGTFVVQVELTWTVDHFSYAAVAGHVERCV